MIENGFMRFNDKDNTVFVSYGDRRFGMISIIKQKSEFSKVYLISNNELVGETKINTDQAINIIASLRQK